VRRSYDAPFDVKTSTDPLELFNIDHHQKLSVSQFTTGALPDSTEEVVRPDLAYSGHYGSASNRYINFSKVVNFDQRRDAKGSMLTASPSSSVSAGD
jgi:hypothetical protein